jgi:hypothetical protein
MRRLPAERVGDQLKYLTAGTNGLAVGAQRSQRVIIIQRSRESRLIRIFQTLSSNFTMEGPRHQEFLCVLCVLCGSNAMSGIKAEAPTTREAYHRGKGIPSGESALSQKEEHCPASKRAGWQASPDPKKQQSRGPAPSLYESPCGGKYPWPPIGGQRMPRGSPFSAAHLMSPQAIRPRRNFGSGPACQRSSLPARQLGGKHLIRVRASPEAAW